MPLVFKYDRERRENLVPQSYDESLQLIISNVKVAIINTLLSEGKMFRTRKEYPENAMLRPLASIVDLMASFTTHLERWGDRVSLLERLELEMKLYHKSTRMSEERKFAKIRRRLMRIDLIDDCYCETFTRLAKEFVPVVADLVNLIDLLQAICSEGNFLPFDTLPHRPRAFSSATTVLDDDSASNSEPMSTSSSVTTPSPPPSPLNSLLHPPAPPRPHPTTPTWKMALSDRYPVDSLYVSADQLEVFAVVLTAARDARDAVEQAQEQCEERGVLANDMQMVLESWTERCEKFEEEARRWEEEGGEQGPMS